MVRLLLYGYATRVYSSRKIETRTYEDVAFRYLAGPASAGRDRLREGNNYARIATLRGEGQDRQIERAVDAGALQRPLRSRPRDASLGARHFGDVDQIRQCVGILSQQVEPESNDV
jgi:hypothetical protein